MSSDIIASMITGGSLIVSAKQRGQSESAD
jgi:hypothetical protein